MSYAPTQRPLTARSSSSSDMAPIHLSSMHRHRKTVSTGGGRAWSEAEEAYLIETRERKMPYKHIAAQLKKTELACRLHYHQLSFGSKSRRSAATCNGNLHAGHNYYDRSSVTPQPSSFRASPPAQRPLPSFSPPASPPESIHHAQPSSAAATPADLAHKPILPKPFSSSPYNRGTTSSPRNLRLVTDDLSAPSESRSHYVDIARLDRLYDTHRLHFWSTIASEYGGNLSPATLEDAWRRAHGIGTASNFPPTPRGSPQSSLPPADLSANERQPSILTTPFSAVTDPGNKFTSVNKRRDDAPRSAYPALSSGASSTSERKSGMSVTSLLTENKDVRSPAKEKAIDEAMDVDRLSSASGSQAREGSTLREPTPVEPPVSMATEHRAAPIASTA